MPFAPLATSTPKKGGPLSLLNPPNAPRKARSFQRRRRGVRFPPFPNLTSGSETTTTPPSSPPSTIPSLKNPPNAPRKQGLRLPFPIKSEAQQRWAMRRLREEERAEYETWPIRPKYLTFTPMEVEEINDAGMLRFLYEKYAFPSSQPQNPKEEAFFQVMKETLLSHMLFLNISPH